MQLSMSQQLGNEVERQGKVNKSTTPRTALSFQRKEEELPWVGFEPTALCSLGERSTMHTRGEQREVSTHNVFRGTLVPADAGRRRAVVARRERVKTATHPQFKPSLLPMNQPLGNESITTIEHTSKKVEVLPNISSPPTDKYLIVLITQCIVKRVINMGYKHGLRTKNNGKCSHKKNQPH